ncbi:hypothetical protein J6590_046698, partial [Homalodisca vitripennis]
VGEGCAGIARAAWWGRGFIGKSRSLSAACLFVSQSLCTLRTTARRKTSSHWKRRKGSSLPCLL